MLWFTIQEEIKTNGDYNSTLKTTCFFSLDHIDSDLFFSLQVLDVPLTVKIRTGVQEKSNMAHKLIPEMKDWGVSMITVRV